MSRERMQYQPALDGVRALSVAAVLLFHGGVSWMSGGYLGVSTFFTLSGFLITSLLLIEHESTGTVARAAFYTRRARRLLPASLLCIAGVSLASAAGWFKGAPHIRRDALGALFQVFNWVKLAAGESYADLTAVSAGVKKPLEHYWSLAIEEQFYWVWPVVFIGLLALARRVRKSPLAIVACLTAVFALAAPIISKVWGPDAAYWSTPARISEILMGALAAVWLARVRAGGAELSQRWNLAAPVALAVLGVACVSFPTGKGPAYQGALPLVGVASALLIVGLQRDGALRRLLGTRLLAGLGRISYGVYLYHWPVFVLIDRHRWTAPVGVQLLVKCAITLVVALVSYHLVERPIRRSEWLVPRRTLVAALAGTAVVCAAAIVLPKADRGWAIDDSTAAAASFGTETVPPLVEVTASSGPASSANTSNASVSSVSASTMLPVPSRPVRIAVVGDSTADAVGNGLVEWAVAHPAYAKVGVYGSRGCGLVMSGTVQLFGKPIDIGRSCKQDVYVTKLNEVLAVHPDVVMVMVTSWDVADRHMVEGGPIIRPTDSDQRRLIDDTYAAYAALFLDAGVRHVVFVREPVPNVKQAGPQPQTERARHEVIYDAIDKIVAANPKVSMVDLDAWLTTSGLATNAAARPDGIHIIPPFSTQVATEFLGPALVRAALS